MESHRGLRTASQTRRDTTQDGLTVICDERAKEHERREHENGDDDSYLTVHKSKINFAGVCKSTPRGFEHLRAEPNGFLVHLLSRSDTVS